MDKLIRMLSLNDCSAEETIPGVYFPPWRLGSFPFVCFVFSQMFTSKLIESSRCVLTRALCILFKLHPTAYLCSTGQHTVHKNVGYYRESL